MMRTVILAWALLAPAAALAHGQHPPAGPHAHGLWHLPAGPALGVLVVAVCVGLAALIGARRARKRGRTA